MSGRRHRQDRRNQASAKRFVNSMILMRLANMPTNLYGPGDNYHPENSHVLPALIRRFYEAVETGTSTVTCWGSGLPLREFLHVDDLGEACVFALERWQPLSDELPILNVGTGVDMSICELAHAVAHATGYKGKIEWDTRQT